MRLIASAYTKLFASTGATKEWLAKWAEVLPRVSPAQRRMLDSPLSLKELENTLRSLPSGKCPGHDGFPREFYVAFWADLKDLVCDAVQAS